MVEKTNKHQDFADRLNLEMSKKNLSVKQLSLAGQVTYEMARRYTLGTAKPRDEKLIRIAEWLNVPPAWLDYGATEAATESDTVQEIGTDFHYDNLMNQSSPTLAMRKNACSGYLENSPMRS
jgi:transcriptional regulator with XRE-family HTH domain